MGADGGLFRLIGAYVAFASFVYHSLVVLVIAFTESFGYACVAKKRRRYPRIHFGHLFSGGKTLASMPTPHVKRRAIVTPTVRVPMITILPEHGRVVKAALPIK